MFSNIQIGFNDFNLGIPRASQDPQWGYWAGRTRDPRHNWVFRLKTRLFCG
jgi:hypothetical protein